MRFDIAEKHLFPTNLVEIFGEKEKMPYLCTR